MRHRWKKDKFMTHFGHFSKMQLLNFVNTNLLLHSQNTALVEILDHSDFCAFIDFLQMFKVGKFAS